jgi:hypothetical protein
LVDFDGDGRLDLLSGSNCCDSLAFHLFCRLQNGSWAARQRFSVQAPADTRWQVLGGLNVVSAADWNGDGVPDLLFAPAKNPGVFVAFGPFGSAREITLSHEIPLQPRGTAFALSVADWDRDGKPDLLVGQVLEDGRRGIFWYRNLGGPGEPRLAEGKLLVADPSDTDVIRGFCVCDWNDDGRPDLIVTREERYQRPPGSGPWHWRGTVWAYLRGDR